MKSSIADIIARVALLLLFIVLVLTRLWQIHKERQSIRRNNENNGNNISPPGGGGGGDGTTNNNNEITDSGLKFTLKDRIELYNKIFDSNGNQLILQDKHIKTKAKSTSANDDDGNDVFIDIELADTAEGNERVDSDNDDDDDDTSSIYLSVESERRLTRTHLDSTRSLCLDLDLQKDNNKDNNKDKEKKQMISGTCIICFEEFMKNDVIVWSQDSKCSHVYHKECMVNYLASNAQHKVNSTLNVHDNPCPTCRQNYCTVTDEDLVKMRCLQQLVY